MFRRGYLLERGKNLADLIDKAAARLNLGLGDAATKTVGEAAGNVMPVGAFGLGASDPVAVTDFNALAQSGFYHATGANRPVPGETTANVSFYVLVERLSASAVKQTAMLFTDPGTPQRIFIRHYGKTAWQPWQEIAHAGVQPGLMAPYGYQKLLGGLLLQWGSIDRPNTNPDAEIYVTFPVAYSSQVVALSGMAIAQTTFDPNQSLNGKNISKTGFTAVFDGYQSTIDGYAKATWFAMGY